MNIYKKFAKLGFDNAPGQEGRQKIAGLNIRGEMIQGEFVDFSHGNLEAFPPLPGSLESYIEGVRFGQAQAYTEYRGDEPIRKDVAEKLSSFMGKDINYDTEIILTPGTQGALFLAIGANVVRGDKVAYVEPDYFANRKMIEFFDAELFPIQLEWMKYNDRAGIDLVALEKAFQSGVKLFIYSNPNNPTGAVYSREEVGKISELGKRYNVTIIADELYSRQIFQGHTHTHICSLDVAPENLITIIGPSKTESMSGYRVGVAFGTAPIIERMEKLQAIVSLRCSGYNQIVFRNWFNEQEGWLNQRIQAHQSIRDESISLLNSVEGIEVRPTEGGSYMFVKLPELEISISEFIKILRIQANMIVTPGTEFGPQFTQWFRINFSQDKAIVLDALQRLIKLMERYR